MKVDSSVQICPETALFIQHLDCDQVDVALGCATDLQAFTSSGRHSAVQEAM